MSEKAHISELLRRQVAKRAQGCCEYCLLSETDTYLAFEIDHVIAEKNGGAATLENLAYSCFLCNHYKGSDLSSIDPLTGHIVPLYNPRTQQWRRHFRLNGAIIEPLTASGRATVRLLRLNDEMHVFDRELLIATGHYPGR